MASSEAYYEYDTLKHSVHLVEKFLNRYSAWYALKKITTESDQSDNQIDSIGTGRSSTYS